MQVALLPEAALPPKIIPASFSEIYVGVAVWGAEIEIPPHETSVKEY